MTADMRGTTEGVNEYALDVILVLIEGEGLDAFQATGLTSIHANEVRLCFDESLAPKTCGVRLMKFYNVGRKTS